MRVLITGASSGIGYSMAKYFSNLGYDLILVSRDIKKLNKIKGEFSSNIEIVSMDLSDLNNCICLHQKYPDIDILINNAGFGLLGELSKTSLDKEIDMINLNVIGLHILCKLYLQDMVKKNCGYILNVGSIASFLPGPLMSTYYASKAYVLRLTEAIYEELRRGKSNVCVSVLCPGPVDTNFDNVAGVRFKLKSISSDYVAKYAIDKMFKKKLVIIPSFKIKLLHVVSKFIPDKILARFVYISQKKKC